MKIVNTGIGNFKARCYYGESEFAKYAEIEHHTTGNDKPIYNSEQKGCSCLNAIWVHRGDDPVTMAHELIHYLFILHEFIGAKETGSKELFAYQHTYLMQMFFREEK